MSALKWFRFHKEPKSRNLGISLGITNKCINSYQIISLSCFYMFRQLCAILRELVCAFWVKCQFGFWLIKFCVVCDCVYTMRCLSMLPKFCVVCGCVYTMRCLSMLPKFCVVCGCVYTMRCLSMLPYRQTNRYTPDSHRVYIQPHATQSFINQNLNWHVTQKVQTSCLRMAHSCRNM
jgi:hypothetical protein